MKALIHCAVLLLWSSAGALESYIPVLKDGWASAEANQGKSKYLRVANGTKSWLTFATGSYNLSEAVSAHLAIYIDEIATKGKLIVQALEDAPATLESTTGLDNIKAAETIADREISADNLESIVFMDITAAVKKEGFKGVLLSSETLDLTLSSKEGALKPFILLKKEVKQFSIEEKSIITSQLADNAVTNAKIDSLDYNKIYNKPSIASAGHSHTLSNVERLNDTLTHLTGDISNNKTEVSSLSGKVTALEKKDSYPPTGDAGGALSGEYPNPSLKKGAVTSENILNGTIKAEDLSEGALGGKSDKDHTHSKFADIQIGEESSPKIAMIMWEDTTASSGSSTSIPLDGSKHSSCPNPDGIISLYGLLFNGKEMIPTGFGTGTNNEWYAMYEKGTSGLVPDKLIIETPGSNTQGKKVRIFCIYQP